MMVNNHEIKNVIKLLSSSNHFIKTWWSLIRVIDGGEPAEFKTLFKRWKDVGEVTSLKWAFWLYHHHHHHVTIWCSSWNNMRIYAISLFVSRFVKCFYTLRKMSYAGPGRGVAKTVQTRFKIPSSYEKGILTFCKGLTRKRWWTTRRCPPALGWWTTALVWKRCWPPPFHHSTWIFVGQKYIC